MASENWECTIFVGNLPMDIKEREIDDLFYKYGKITSIDIKTPRHPPAYAFVQFSDPRDADDACYYKDGVRFDGSPLRVKLSRPPRERRGYDDRDRDRGHNRGRDRDDDRGGSYSNDRKRGRDNYTDDYGSGKKGKRTGYKIKVSGLPVRASWQDLKDFGRKCGHPTYSKVLSANDGIGVVEFETEDTMLRAIEELDDTDFTSHDGDVARVRVERAETEEETGSSLNFHSDKSDKYDDHDDNDDKNRDDDENDEDDARDDDDQDNGVGKEDGDEKEDTEPGTGEADDTDADADADAEDAEVDET